jgi:hypothetical protein
VACPHSEPCSRQTGAARSDPQSSGAISSAARRAPSVSTGREATGRSISSAIAAAMTSGGD